MQVPFQCYPSSSWKWAYYHPDWQRRRLLFWLQRYGAAKLPKCFCRSACLEFKTWLPQTHREVQRQEHCQSLRLQRLRACCRPYSKWASLFIWIQCARLTWSWQLWVASSSKVSWSSKPQICNYCWMLLLPHSFCVWRRRNYLLMWQKRLWLARSGRAGRRQVGANSDRRLERQKNRLNWLWAVPHSSRHKRGKRVFFREKRFRPTWVWSFGPDCLQTDRDKKLQVHLRLFWLLPLCRNFRRKTVCLGKKRLRIIGNRKVSEPKRVDSKASGTRLGR